VRSQTIQRQFVTDICFVVVVVVVVDDVQFLHAYLINFVF